MHTNDTSCVCSSFGHIAIGAGHLAEAGVGTPRGVAGAAWKLPPTAGVPQWACGASGQLHTAPQRPATSGSQKRAGCRVPAAAEGLQVVMMCRKPVVWQMPAAVYEALHAHLHVHLGCCSFSCPAGRGSPAGPWIIRRALCSYLQLQNDSREQHLLNLKPLQLTQFLQS